jgi:hypothetical protein
MLQGILAETDIEAPGREWKATGFTNDRDHSVLQLVRQVSRGNPLEFRVKVEANEKRVASACV